MIKLTHKTLGDVFITQNSLCYQDGNPNEDTVFVSTPDKEVWEVNKSELKFIYGNREQSTTNMEGTTESNIIAFPTQDQPKEE